MRTVIQRFMAAATALAVLVGLYLTALSTSLEWAFVVVVLVSSAWALWPRLQDLIVRVRMYESVAGERDALREQLDTSRRGVDSERAAWAEERERLTAVTRDYGDLRADEGRMEVLGALLSGAEAPPLVMFSATEGELTLMARMEGDGHTKVGARYRVVNEVGDLKGVVQAMRFDADNELLHLHCVHEAVPEFWNYLRERAPITSQLPADVKLVPSKYEKPASWDVPSPLWKSGRTS